MGNRALCCGRVCPKVALHGIGEHELFEDPHGCDPAGAIFHETLEDLNEVDRLLLLFGSSSNLSAVRWLMMLGANPNACDTNGTTCLHAACRSGSLAIVREFISAGLSVNAADAANWTPLHVAVFMGRRAITIDLMQKGADLSVPNLRGSSPSELCSDTWLREAISSYIAHRQLRGHTPWQFNRHRELTEDIQVSSRLRFEPFFVPRQPVVRDTKIRAGALQQLGVELFNKRPGQGLAFLVATGIVRDFPIELSSFIMDNPISLSMVGEFLGEDFSLSQTLRLEFVNSVRLTGTGVVACLSKVFKQFKIPSDMQKIDRIVDGIAQIWWRQHEQLQEFSHAVANVSSGSGFNAYSDGEVEGVELMRQLGSYGCLHQLMFSTVMLHWSLYAPLPASQRVTQEQWLEKNAGLTGGAEEIRSSVGVSEVSRAEAADAAIATAEELRRTQCMIYNVVNRAFLPQLQIWGPKPDESSGSGSVPDAPAGQTGLGRRPAPHDQDFEEEEQPFVGSPFPIDAAGRYLRGGPGPASGSSVRPSAHVKDTEAAKATVEGWGRLLGGGLPSPAGATGSLTYKHIRNILSETTSTPLVAASPGNSRQDSLPGDPVSGGFNIEMPLSAACRYPAPLGDFENAFGRSPDEELRMPGSEWPTTQRGDRVWLSVRCAQLFLAPKACEWAPYAFLHLCESVSFAVNEKNFVVTITGVAPSKKEDPADLGKYTGGSDAVIRPSRSRLHSRHSRAEAEAAPLQLIFLLPDGRWQVMEVPRLVVQFQDVQRLGHWILGLSEHCRNATIAPVTPVKPPSGMSIDA